MAKIHRQGSSRKGHVSRQAQLRFQGLMAGLLIVVVLIAVVIGYAQSQTKLPAPAYLIQRTTPPTEFEGAAVVSYTFEIPNRADFPAGTEFFLQVSLASDPGQMTPLRLDDGSPHTFSWGRALNNFSLNFIARADQPDAKVQYSDYQQRVIKKVDK